MSRGSDDGVLLSLRGLAKRFGDVTALQGVDLDVRAGEFLTLLGPSGCGKTTLLRIIGGFEHATSGEMALDGEPLGRRTPERRPFNMVFQSYALFPHMTVAQNVAYGLRTARRPRAEVAARVAAALRLVGLEDRGDRNVRELSGGQQQRVALVRALVNEPRVLLLDEPLGALDLQLRKRLQHELRDLQRRLGTTFVYVTHDQEEALSLSHRVVVMQDGAVVQVGTPQEIYERPRTRFVAEFVGEADLIPCRVDAQRGDVVDVVLGQEQRATFAHFGDLRLEPGRSALVALRPEHLSLCAPGDGVIEGTVTSSVFRGADWLHDLRVADGYRVRARGDEPAAVGPAGVTVRPGRGVVVPAEASQIETGSPS
jgi:spermidine/putrescine transport system ATP-binding protein